MPLPSYIVTPEPSTAAAGAAAADGLERRRQRRERGAKVSAYAAMCLASAGSCAYAVSATSKQWRRSFGKRASK